MLCWSLMTAVYFHSRHYFLVIDLSLPCTSTYSTGMLFHIYKLKQRYLKKTFQPLFFQVLDCFWRYIASELPVLVVTWYVICSVMIWICSIMMDIMDMIESSLFLLRKYMILVSECRIKMNWILSWILINSRSNLSCWTYWDQQT